MISTNKFRFCFRQIKGNTVNLGAGAGEIKPEADELTRAIEATITAETIFMIE